MPDLQNNYCRVCNRGPEASDVRNRFTWSSVYELPVGRKQRYFSDVSGVVDRLVSGWQVGSIISIQSGQPLTATLPFDNPNVGEGAETAQCSSQPQQWPQNYLGIFRHLGLRHTSAVYLR